VDPTSPGECALNAPAGLTRGESSAPRRLPALEWLALALTSSHRNVFVQAYAPLTTSTLEQLWPLGACRCLDPLTDFW